MRAKKNKKKLSNILVKLTPFVFLIVVVIWGFALFRQGNLLSNAETEREKEISKQLINLASPTITLIPTPTLNQITYAPHPTLDPDPSILCNISSNCGGGKTPLRQNECNSSTCCQIGDKWIFYKNKNKCTQDQIAYYGNSGNNNHAYPTLALLPTYAPYPTYSYTPYATPTLTAQQAQGIIDQHNSQVQQCRSNVNYQYAGLIQNCNQYGGSSAYDACKSIYEGQRQSAYNSCGSTY